MKFVCERDKLLSAFQTAATVAPSRSPKPILQNVKLIVTPQQATLLATDMETGIRIDVPGIEVEPVGSAVLPVGRFGSILRESTDAKLLVEAEPQGTLRAGRPQRVQAARAESGRVSGSGVVRRGELPRGFRRVC